MSYDDDVEVSVNRKISAQSPLLSPNNDHLWIYLPLDGPLENNSNIANYVEFRTARCRNYDNPNRVDNRASPLGPFR